MYRSNSYVRNKKNFGATLLKQILICIIIVLLVIFIKKMDIAIVNQGIDKVQASLDRDYSVSEIRKIGENAADRLRNVPSAIAEAFQKSESKLAFVPPTDEAAATAVFSSDTVDSQEPQGKMVFQSDQELQVHSVGGGIVSQIGEDSEHGRFIKIVHGNDIVSVYGGCSQIYVQALEKVKKGQLIASIRPEGDGCLSFEMWSDDVLIDPSEYIDFSGKP